MRLPVLAVALTLALALSSCAGDDPPSARKTPAPQAPNSIGEATPGASGTWSVVGVRFDDTLNVRRAPGTSAGVVMRLGPLVSGLSSGRTRRVGDSVWRQVSTDGRRGWANGAYLARLGRFSDVTADFRTIGAVPTRRAVARAVVRRWGAGVEGEVRWAIARRTSRAWIVDVFGAGDDSVSGAPMCARGVAGGGICV